MFVPYFSCFLNFFKFSGAHIVDNRGNSTLVTADVVLVRRLERNFIFDEGTIALFDNIPDGIDLLYLDGFGVVVILGNVRLHFIANQSICSLPNTPFYIATDSLKSCHWKVAEIEKE